LAVTSVTGRETFASSRSVNRGRGRSAGAGRGGSSFVRTNIAGWTEPSASRDADSIRRVPSSGQNLTESSKLLAQVGHDRIGADSRVRGDTSPPPLADRE
jgi:hypothetical protein